MLVSKQRKNQASDWKNVKTSHLSSYRFCCDFRYLNSQTQPFRYTIPNIQELTESFTNTTPNFITLIDMSSGVFLMDIHPESANYTAFNTRFGTYTFTRLPIGLGTAPNSFQLLMDIVLRCLTSKSVLCYSMFPSARLLSRII